MKKKGSWLSGLPNSRPLLPRSNGEPGRPSAYSRPFAKAVIGAGLDPAKVTIYALRYSSVVRRLLGGVPIRVDVLSRAAMLDPAAHWR
jgi:hypothetical protein